MNQYDARQQFIEGLEQYVSGIETDERLLRLARNVSAYHDQMPAEAHRLVKAILEAREGVAGSYAGAVQALQHHLGERRSERAAWLQAPGWCLL
jgi:hypothetical protein